MNVKQNLVASSKYSIKCPYSMDAEFIVVHNTANDAPAENEIKYMISNDKEVSFHYAVDDQEVVQGLPTNHNAWACGDGGSGNGNRKGIQVEICYSKSGGERFAKAEQNASKFIAELLHERGWTTSKVKKHQDFSGKNCPHRTLADGWQRFVAMIQAELDALNKPTINELYRVRKSWTDAGSQKGAYSNLEYAKKECDKHEGYSVFNSKGESVYSEGEKAPTEVGFKSYTVKIICDTLNVRKEADFNAKIVTTVKRNQVFTIVGEENGLGELKSGVGYISLNSKYVTKL